MDGLTNRNLFLETLGTGSLRSCGNRLSFFWNLSPWLRGGCLPCVFTWSPFVCVCALVSFSYKDTSQIKFGPTYVTFFFTFGTLSPNTIIFWGIVDSTYEFLGSTIQLWYNAGLYCSLGENWLTVNHVDTVLLSRCTEKQLPLIFDLVVLLVVFQEMPDVWCSLERNRRLIFSFKNIYLTVGSLICSIFLYFAHFYSSLNEWRSNLSGLVDQSNYKVRFWDNMEELVFFSDL